MKAIIIGAGIGGLSAAIALRKIGLKVKVFESKQEIRFVGAGLGIGANAVRALQQIDVGNRVLQEGKVLDELRIVTPTGKILQRTETAALSNKYGSDNVTIDRGKLLELLLSALGPEKVVKTGKTVVHCEQNHIGVKVRFEDGSTEEGDLLIGADGIHSNIRRSLLPGAIPQYAGYTCWRGVTDAEQLYYNSNVFIETWGSNGRFGIVPLANQRIYWFACVNAKEKDPEFKQYTTKNLIERFSSYHEPITQILEKTAAEKLLHHDIYYLPPIQKITFGRIVLLGDAAHAMTPNMGQGAGQSIEDAIILASLLKHHMLSAALEKYERERLGRTAKITHMSNRIGKLAQLQQSSLVAIRDALFPLLPSGIMQKQLKYLYEVKLEGRL